MAESSVPTVPATPGMRQVPALDAVRGVAILMVMLRHAAPGPIGGGGFVGVELFFVLSGYLITAVLLRGAEHGVGLRSFYRNRLLRLVPALVVVVLVVLVVQLAGDGTLTGHAAGGTAVALLYLADVAGPLHLPQLSHLIHLWTLAIEQQFYLLWPFLLGFGLRRRALGPVAAAGIGASAVVLLGAALAVPHVHSMYEWPTTWAGTLLGGCAMTIGLWRPWQDPRAAWLALALLVGLIFVPDAKEHLVSYLVVIPVVVAASGVLIANAAGAQPLPVLRSVWLQRLGLISYGAYLWNLPLADWAGGWPAIPLSIAAAAASYVLVERRFLRRRRGAPSRSPRSAS